MCLVSLDSVAREKCGAAAAGIGSEAISHESQYATTQCDMKAAGVVSSWLAITF
jgi:hypothetical protein